MYFSKVKRATVALIVGAVFLAGCRKSEQLQRSGKYEMNEIIEIEPIFDADFSSKKFAQTVNFLRGQCKKESIRMLRFFLSKSPEHGDTVLILCRLIFENSNGWDPPLIGMPYPEL